MIIFKRKNPKTGLSMAVSAEQPVLTDSMTHAEKIAAYEKCFAPPAKDKAQEKRNR